MKHKRNFGEEAKACRAAYQRGCQGSQGFSCDGCPIYEREAAPIGEPENIILGAIIPAVQHIPHRRPPTFIMDPPDPYDMAKVLLG